MVEFLREHQLNIMLALGSICFIISVFLLVTGILSRRKKYILVMMELSAGILLFADRFAYIYRGNTSRLGFYMVRISNYLTFAMSLIVVLSVVLYLADILVGDKSLRKMPLCLKLAVITNIIGEILLIISQYTGMYYTFDETNHYQRASLFMVSYSMPLICLVLVMYALIRYRSKLSRIEFISMTLFAITPAIASVAQIYLYGLSLTNISFVGMAVVFYIFVIIDINTTVKRAHEIEIQNMQGENARMKKLFEQTAMAFVSAVETKDDTLKGCSLRVAECAKKIAEHSKMNTEECEKVYYAALLHNIGMVGISDEKIKKAMESPEKKVEYLAEMPNIGNEILENIKEMPYLSLGALYCHEKYDGTGHPQGLKGEEIPEIARIIAVADAYVLMKTDTSYGHKMPDYVVREVFVKGSGEDFDPKYADIMIKIIDEESKESNAKDSELENEIICSKYREQFTTGIPVEYNIAKIKFKYNPVIKEDYNGFSAPSIILFDSYDGRVHDNERSVEIYKYLEYGEIWFDEHSIRSEARRIKENIKARQINENVDASQINKRLETGENSDYEIVMGRCEDHLKLKMTSPEFEKEVIVALPNASRSAFIALTGENCRIYDISLEHTEEMVQLGDIERIVSITNYIDRMESDIKNVQIDTPRSATSEGIELKDRLRLNFHTMSLPGACFLWHCPYIVIFHSDDGKVGGKNYRELGLIKLYGENEGNTKYSTNSISMKKKDDFPGWDKWNEINKNGMECEVSFVRKNEKIITKTSNLGIEIENITTISDESETIFVALTGDQVAITDIRVR